MRNEAERPAARTGTEDLRRKAEGAAGAVQEMHMGNVGERPSCLPVPPLRAAQHTGKCGKVETGVKTC